MAHHPEEALDAQVSLLRWTRTRDCADFMDIWRYCYSDNRGHSPYAAEALTRQAFDALAHAETYYVSPDMTRIVEAAAKTASCESLHSGDIPTNKAFVYFSVPIRYYFKKNEGEMIAKGDPISRAYHLSNDRFVDVRAVTWEQEMVKNRFNELQLGLNLSIYVDRDSWLKQPVDKTIAPPESIPLRAGGDMLFKEEARGTEAFAEKLNRLTLFEMTGWVYDTPWYALEHSIYENTEEPQDEYTRAINGLSIEDQQAGATVPSIAFFRKLVFAFSRLVFQRIAVRHKQRMSRPAIRRAAREDIELENGMITVVKLRREYEPKPGDHEPTEMAWSHRWVVSGFWRNQYYPSLNRHIRIYIHAYIKGPEDKPLIIKDRIYSLER
jgi:hypothetical protein